MLYSESASVGLTYTTAGWKWVMNLTVALLLSACRWARRAAHSAGVGSAINTYRWDVTRLGLLKNLVSYFLWNKIYTWNIYNFRYYIKSINTIEWYNNRVIRTINYSYWWEEYIRFTKGPRGENHRIISSIDIDYWLNLLKKIISSKEV